MTELPPGWATDLAILALDGSELSDHGDHLVVRTPANPTYHWGNFVFVRDRAAVGDAERWVRRFRAEFPDADWTAVGLITRPSQDDAWAALGLDLAVDDVLHTPVMPRQTALAADYTVRRLETGDDWEQSVRRALAENLCTGEHDPAVFEPFIRAKVEARRSLCERGAAAFFGAFSRAIGDDGSVGHLVADLGVVCCGRTARYQDVGTDAAHRRRGLASHLLGSPHGGRPSRGAPSGSSSPRRRTLPAVCTAPSASNRPSAARWPTALPAAGEPPLVTSASSSGQGRRVVVGSSAVRASARQGVGSSGRRLVRSSPTSTWREGGYATSGAPGAAAPGASARDTASDVCDLEPSPDRVGGIGIEPTTSCVSCKCSNQLS